MTTQPEDPIWPDVKAAAIEVVLEAARWADKNLTYKKLAGAVNDRVQGADLHYHGRAMDWLLYDLVRIVLDFDEGAPMISAVVRYSAPDNPVPGEGFWKLASQLASEGWSPAWTPPDPKADRVEKQAFWGVQAEACYSYWTASRLREFHRWFQARD